MKTVTKSMMTFIAGLLTSIGKAEAYPTEQGQHAADEPTDPVSLRPLNLPGDNQFAAHRSHSSHRSHRSSSGGGYQSPAPAAPQKQQDSNPAAPGTGFSAPGGAQPTDPGRAAPVTPAPVSPQKPVLNRAEKLKLQVMRTQIALTSLGLYKGPISGELNDSTKESLKHFQTLKGIEANGLMTTDTINALGVPAVQ
jgi:His-Xaa-Ser repeat protein HxsA